MKPNEVITLAKNSDCKFVDLKLVDLLGAWQHTTVPSSRLNAALFEAGMGFDGSSVRGWQPVNASDLRILPDPASARIDPFAAFKTLTMVCDVVDPVSGQPYERDPRYIARKAERHLAATGIAETACFGPKAEFCIFDAVRYDNQPRGSFYEVDSDEAFWNSGREVPNLGHKLRPGQGYCPVPPADSQADLRADIMTTLIECGVAVEVGHHEAGAAGQGEIGMRFSTLTRMADSLLWFKYTVKNVAHRHSKTATFMPKPIFGDSGNGMHCHLSLWRDGHNAFAGDGYGGLSEIGLFFLGGILQHARALAAFTNPTTNSYRRLVKGYEAPVSLTYGSGNRSAAIRLPVATSAAARRIDVRFPDPSCNPYLAFAALLMAGLDGIERRLDPGEPLEQDLYALSPAELQGVPRLPHTLAEALDALEADHEFLLRGDVFTRDVIDTWLAYKRSCEVDEIRARPVPYELFLYYDV